MKVLIARLLSLFFFLQVISPTVTADQLPLQAIDIEPPSIKFDAGEDSISDGIKSISAEVTDNIEVARVTLYYKFADDVGFTPKNMKSTSGNTYSAEVMVDSVISSKLEFYIRAEDVSGNSVFEGQKFSPYAYTIVPVAVTEDIKTSVTEPPKEEEGMDTLTLILIGLGVAALAGGGGGGGSAPSTGSVTITTEIPD